MRTSSLTSFFWRAGATLICLAATSHAYATTYSYSGETFFCTATCDSFGALGGATGGSGNSTNSVVAGTIEFPTQAPGPFSITLADDIPFAFTITTSAIGLTPPVIGPANGCPPPNQVGQLCNPITVNPLPLNNSLATVEGSGVIGPDGQFESGTLIFTFTTPPFSNNLGVITFDLADGSGEGTVFGVIPFVRVSGSFVLGPEPTRFNIGGDFFFCGDTCGQFASFGGAAGNSGNLVNSVIEGWLDLRPDAVDGSFSFSGLETVEYELAIRNSGADLIAPEFCPEPDADLICNTGTVNPMPITSTTTSGSGSGMQLADGSLSGGVLTFRLLSVPMFDFNDASLNIDLNTGQAEILFFGDTVIMQGTAAAADSAFDEDADGLVVSADNCSEVANYLQDDANEDGFGNVCDADLNDDCVVNVVDLGVLRQLFFSDDAVADFNGDGVVNVTDLGLMRLAFFSAPGPSGVANSCAD